MRRVTGRRGDRGAVLAFVVLLMLALLGLAHGGLVASLSEVAASRAAARHLRLRGAADHALGRILSRPPLTWAESLGPWDTAVVSLPPAGPDDALGMVRRLSAEAWLLEGRATATSGVSVLSARLAWALDPMARVKALPAVAVIGREAPALVAGTVDVSAAAAVESPMESDGCEPWQAELQEGVTAAPLSIVSLLPDTAAEPGLGLLDLDRLLGLARVAVQGGGTPGPVEVSGICAKEEPWSWGDPDRPWRPCGAHFPVRAAAGDLFVEGGVGQGLLLVDGDLTLDAGARFYGMVVVSGMLRLSAGSSLQGMAVAAGGLEVAPGTTLRASLCWAVRVLDAQRGLIGGFVPVGGPIGPS